jgi:hypothetical protein
MPVRSVSSKRYRAAWPLCCFTNLNKPLRGRKRQAARNHAALCKRLSPRHSSSEVEWCVMRGADPFNPGANHDPHLFSSSALTRAASARPPSRVCCSTTSPRTASTTKARAERRDRSCRSALSSRCWEVRLPARPDSRADRTGSQGRDRWPHGAHRGRLAFRCLFLTAR